MGVRQVLQMTGVELETMDFIPNMLFAEFKLLILLNTIFCNFIAKLSVQNVSKFLAICYQASMT